MIGWIGPGRLVPRGGLADCSILTGRRAVADNSAPARPVALLIGSRCRGRGLWLCVQSSVFAIIAFVESWEKRHGPSQTDGWQETQVFHR